LYYVDSEIAGNVLSATQRVTTNGKTVYDIAFSDGNTYATFDAKTFAKAQPFAASGLPVSARVSVKQNGQYTNYYLNDIAPQGQLSATSAPVALAAPTVPRPQQGGGMSAEDKARVTWLSCLSSAAQSVAGSGAGSFEILAVAQELYAATARGEYKQAASHPEPVVAGVAGAPPVNETDPIPWQ
jgi:hypothetical protein